MESAGTFPRTVAGEILTLQSDLAIEGGNVKGYRFEVVSDRDVLFDRLGAGRHAAGIDEALAGDSGELVAVVASAGRYRIAGVVVDDDRVKIGIRTGRRPGARLPLRAGV